jgi:hypothetical protein
MSTKDSLFTVAGITSHVGHGACGTRSEKTKVRYGTDMVRLVKMLTGPTKVEDRTLGICLAPQRVELVELPSGMVKLDALRFLATHDKFQSPEDQAVISEELDKREPKAPRAKRKDVVKVPKAKVKSKLSLDTIVKRGKKDVAVADILAAAAEPVAE